MPTKIQKHMKKKEEKGLFQFLIKNQYVHLSTEDLLEMGIFGPDDVIARIKTLNTIDLLELGILSTDGEMPCVKELSTLDLIQLINFIPEPCITSIKASGVNIDTIYQMITDHNGITHKRVVVYKIVAGGAS